ncbi:MAG TPA: hypothetical protein VE801_02850 [Xanthobacteraceae bacterium]|nr:hypothetical protein [Xanthobacteraceae bacterium]
MSDNPDRPVDIVEEHGSFVLIRSGSRFAVVERRAGRVYPMMPGGRQGEPVSTAGMVAVMAEEGSLPEAEARRLFDELCERGDRLARRIW